MNAAQPELNEERFFNGFSLEWLEAWRFFLSGNPDISREKWQLILERYPDDLDVQVGIDLLNPKEHENESSSEEIKCYWRLGQSLRHLQRFSDAAEVYELCVAKQPTWMNAKMMRAFCLVAVGRTHEAIVYLNGVLETQPDLAIARKNLGLAYLAAGDLERGFAEYEYRFVDLNPPLANYPQPIWQGEACPRRGAGILLQCEQGLGDMIQFVRYAKLVQQRGFRVLLSVHASLTNLFRSCRDIDVVVPHGLELPPFDYRISIMSLPRVMGTTLQTIPAEVPYLEPDHSRIAKWKKRLDEHVGFRVGIVWQGNPKHPFDHFRSIPLTAFEPVAEMPGVRLISLQKNAGEEQLNSPGLPFEVINFGETLDMDSLGQVFLDTAAIMKSLDLVIACDTSIIHLAGALAVPVWLGLGLASDWRWFREREDSPWYPTLRIFRQRIPGDWTSVIDDMARKLKQLDRYRNVRNCWPSKFQD